MNRSFCARAILRLDSSERFDPRWACARFSLCSRVCLLPRFIFTIFKIDGQWTSWSFLRSRSLSFVSSVCRLPVAASLRRAISSGDLMRTRSRRPFARSLARCSGDSFRPLLLADIFALASSEWRRFRLDRATGNTLYPRSDVAPSASIQCCSLDAKREESSTTSRTQNKKEAGPYLFHARCNFGLWWLPLRNLERWTHRLIYRLTALPTYTSPVRAFSILYMPLALGIGECAGRSFMLSNCTPGKTLA